MSGRDFGILGGSIWNSRAFNTLGSDSARLAFIYVLTTPNGNRIGTYRLNPSYMAADRSISQASAEADILDMAQVGLVDYDAGEQIIHIRKFFKRNKITNRNHLMGSIRVVEGLPQSSAMLGLVAADIILSAFEVSEGWSDRDAMLKMRSMALENCEPLIVKHNAVKYLHDITKPLSIPLSIALSEALSEPLSIPLPEGVRIPLSNEGDGDGDGDSNAEGDSDSDGDAEADGDAEGDTDKKERAQNRKPRKAGAASASKRAAPASHTQREGAALRVMVDNVKAVASGKSTASAILKPTPAQLHDMVAAKQITAKQRDSYLSKAKA